MGPKVLSNLAPLVTHVYQWPGRLHLHLAALSLRCGRSSQHHWALPVGSTDLLQVQELADPQLEFWLCWRDKPCPDFVRPRPKVWEWEAGPVTPAFAGASFVYCLPCAGCASVGQLYWGKQDGAGNNTTQTTLRVVFTISWVQKSTQSHTQATQPG